MQIKASGRAEVLSSVFFFAINLKCVAQPEGNTKALRCIYIEKTVIIFMLRKNSTMVYIPYQRMVMTFLE